MPRSCSLDLQTFGSCVAVVTILDRSRGRAYQLRPAAEAVGCGACTSRSRSSSSTPARTWRPTSPPRSRSQTEAAAGGARLVALPEYLQFRGPDDGFRASARPIPGPHTEPFAEVARRHDAWILESDRCRTSWMNRQRRWMAAVEQGKRPRLGFPGRTVWHRRGWRSQSPGRTRWVSRCRFVQPRTAPG